MKKLFISALFAVFAISASAQSSFTVGSYNMRYRNDGDVERGNGWETRSKGIFELINYERWDIFGGQELLHDQMQDLARNLKNYDYIGVAREDGAEDGEYAPIFFRKDRMECLEKGWFWISETPEAIGSIGWDADQCRICTWGKFEDKRTKWQFWFFNLHMDHRGIQARREGAKLILAKIKEMCGDQPYILTGDFNVDQNNEIFGILKESGMLVDTYDTAEYRMALTGTTNSFNADHYTDRRIDHIFVSPRFKVHDYGVLTFNYWNETGELNERGRKVYEAKTLSDHNPVVATVELPRYRAPQDWADYGMYEAANKTVKDPKVVFMGDSITEVWYEEHPEFFTENNYVGRGISGQVTAQMLARFRSDVINHNPETVVILGGTNDIAMNQGYVSIQHIYENIISMAEIAKANKIKVLLCSVLPADSYSWSWEIDRERAIRSIRELNTKLEKYCSDTKGVTYVDFFPAMATEERSMKKEYQKDAVHPNLTGYLVMEEVIQKYIR